MSQSKSVRILNPVSGGSEYTSMNRARRYVKKGRAVWNGKAIEFIATDYRHLAAVESVERKRLPVRCFDDGLATEQQIAGLPVAGDPMALLYGKRETGPVTGSRPAIVLSRRFAVESVP